MAGLEDRRAIGGGRPHWNPRGLTGTARAYDAAADPWIGIVLDDRFEILERIGQGGVATVYRARERGIINRDVAIKLLTLASSGDDDTVARFKNEAQLIADIDHPNVVRLVDVKRTSNGQLYIIMELLRGQNLLQTLQELAADDDALSWRRLAPMMLHVCAALQAAHARGVIHRDIKPNNCFRVSVAGDRDFIKVLDFGIAKFEVPLAPATSPQGPLTLPDRFLGTPHYAAPELIDPRRGWPVDGRVDVFAVGVMMYQCLTGELPFAGMSDRAALVSTVNEPPRSPRERFPHRGISPEVDALIVRAMARDPAHRFADIAALAARIRSASADRTIITVGTIDDAPVDEAATLRRPLSPHDAATRRVERDDHTPRSTLLTAAAPITEPEPPHLEAPPPRDARGVYATYILMGIGVALLLLLLVHELRKKPQRTEIVIDTLESTSAEASPAERPVTAPEPTGATDETSGETDIIEDTESPPPPPPPPRPLQAPAEDERRRRKIAQVAQDIALPRFTFGCTLDMTRRWQLPLELDVAASGKLLGVKATPPAPPDLRLDDDELDCLVKRLGTFTFPHGSSALNVKTIVRRGPP